MNINIYKHQKLAKKNMLPGKMGPRGRCLCSFWGKIQVVMGHFSGPNFWQNDPQNAILAIPSAPMIGCISVTLWL